MFTPRKNKNIRKKVEVEDEEPTIGAGTSKGQDMCNIETADLHATIRV